jgi:hypothetical protein
MATTNADRLAKYKRQIEHSRKWREDERHDETWRRLVDLYALRHFNETYVDDMDRVADLLHDQRNLASNLGLSPQDHRLRSKR